MGRSDVSYMGRQAIGIGVSALIACLVLFNQAAIAQTEAAKVVLVVYDGGREFNAIQMIDEGIEATLTQAMPDQVTIFREYLDLTRIHSPEYEQVLAEFYRTKYAKDKPDVIVAVRGRPLDFLLKNGEALFPGVPIVSSGMEMRQVLARKLPLQVTGTAIQYRFWLTIELALQVQPETVEFAIVTGGSPNDLALEALVREELQGHRGPVKFSYLARLPIDELLQRVSTLPPRSALLFVSCAQDGNGRSFLPNDALKLVTARSSVPVYISSEGYLDCGAVGGDLVSFVALGKDAGSLAHRILSGEDPAAIPFKESTTRTRKVDTRQLQRWGIPIENVPANCTLLNVPAPGWSWKTHWRMTSAVAFLILVQAGLIAALLIHRRRRRDAEESLRKSEASQHAAVLEERSRMARDMHDTLAQGFTGVITQLEAALSAMVHGAPDEADEHIHRAGDLARQSLGEARRSLRALRPQALDKVDWWVALDALMKQMTADSGLRAEFTTSGRPQGLAPTVEENLLRIHQEIVTNALKHARATSLVTALSFEANVVRLDVRDNGCGFDTKKVSDGLGLIGIRERVSKMNGDVSIESHVGIGTRICVVVPFHAGVGQAQDTSSRVVHP